MKKTFITVLLLTFFVLSINAQRKTVSLDGPWKFSIDENNIGISEKWHIKGLPLKKTKTVIVPHTWNVDSGLEDYRGKGWYEKSIIAPTEWQNKRIRLRFDAIYHTATIYLNGKEIGKHIGSGYNTFWIDVSKSIVIGKENKLSVCADNSFSRNNIPFLNSFDWACDGGIYRSVSLIVTDDPLIQSIMIKASPDISNPASITKGKIEVSILLNSIHNATDATMEILITEENQASKNTVWKSVLKVQNANGINTFSQELSGIKAWHFDRPNLYKMQIVIKSGENIKDVESSTFGFRDIHTDGEKIVFNGEPIRLMGVEWMPGSSIKNGMAETNEELEAMLLKLKSVNCMYTRFHWQQDEFIFDWCDRNGMLIQEEIPYWGGVTMVKDTLLELGKKHLDEMISNHFNHPSIICWGIGNELKAHDPINIKGISELYRYAKNLDNTRLVNYVSNSLQQNIISNKNIQPDASGKGDLLNYNDYQEQWYQADPVLIPGILDTIRLSYPNKPLIIAEYGLCEPAHRGGDFRRIKDMLFHQAIYDVSPNVAGGIYFCLNDYRTHMGEDGEGKYKQRVHGVFDINGNPRASAAYLTSISSPIELVGFWPKGDSISIVLLGSLGLPSYSMSGYEYIFSRYGEKSQSESKKYKLPEIKPGQKIEISVKNEFNNSGRLSIFNPSGFLVFEMDL